MKRFTAALLTLAALLIPLLAHAGWVTKEIKWRISAYRELAEVGSLQQLDKLRRTWRDRFGSKPPRPVELLLQAQRVRLLAGARGIDHVECRDEKIMLRRQGELLTVGNRFPRLTAGDEESMLKCVEKWVTTLGSTS